MGSGVRLVDVPSLEYLLVDLEPEIMLEDLLRQGNDVELNKREFHTDLSCGYREQYRAKNDIPF